MSLGEALLVVENQSPVEEPEFSVERVSATTGLYALDAWEFANFGAVTTVFPDSFGGTECPMENLVEGRFEPLDESLIGSLSMDYNNPAAVWWSP